MQKEKIMDPDKTLQTLTERAVDEDSEGMEDAIDDLRDWLDKAGFEPREWKGLTLGTRVLIMRGLRRPSRKEGIYTVSFPRKHMGKVCRANVSLERGIHINAFRKGFVVLEVDTKNEVLEIAQAMPAGVAISVSKRMEL